MTQEEKRKLLACDLMSRVNYWTDLKVDYKGRTYTLFGYGAGRVSLLANPFMSTVEDDAPLIEEVKPYLRSMSSMTEKELESLRQEHLKDEKLYAEAIKGDGSMRGKVVTHYAADYCNEHHLDYRGLIPQGLALEAKEGMYNLNI